MPLVQIAYASSAVDPFSKDELVELLIKSRQKNQENGVTGLLLYKSGNFLQILEGEHDVIKHTLQKIEADSRHKGFMTIFKRNVEKREFPDWSMAFRNLNDPEVDRLPGYNEFLNLSFDPESLLKDSSHVERLIGTFASGIS